ncbi:MULTISPECIES: oxidoreductase [unclassified Pseudomonas]|uniref:oxidoreductase n=1 Tax=unclassified Pseudomonas TaxID=196821 RepID=UPI000C86B23F|nr:MULTISPECIES: oxidoreductase [unclassified Pseudomonas]PMV88664.1 short-chain dehydrogenase/reductase [Pseudomonas sp. GW101-1A09]PMV94673.1 short-chain dehydrogenase/reductase [Pseudomonas sp. FW306-2-2C-B10A]PMV98892.1 short-chain dehydrogenase/reductase [Pseudomonas sp. GW460-C8]PMW06336.1 short-chain dehydrogenase/reductase [Pseudomonas sp. MPR-TSA4]PMW15080.1 short-chain dehydrogenase/reductase [Pseudomonas sp. FW306-2-1A-C05A]
MTTSHTFKRVWLITGASRGIGARIAAAALANGDAVVATARDASSVTQRFGTQPALLAVSLDVTNEAQGVAVAKAAVEHFGRIDVLVNNAGFGLLGAVEEASADEVRRVYETNVFGLLNITRAVLPYMRAARSGHVINLSSVGGYASGPGFGVYCSTKFAVEGLSEALHAELAPVGVKVTVVEPGYFRTEFLEGNSLVESPSTIADYDSTAGEVRKIAKAVTLNQPGDPDKLAQAMIILVEAKKAPLRLPLGSDCVAAIEAKNAFVADQLQTWREVSVSTDY